MNSSDSAVPPVPSSPDASRPSGEAPGIWSPLQLRAAADLYGVDTPPLAGAKVLQLGCGSAEGLIAFALACPGTTVIGVDGDADGIARGNERAQALGLSNLSLQFLDWTAIDSQFGQFDYVVAHGLYGRLSDDASVAVLRICRENLSPAGVAYISYRTNPGWKAAEIMRDAMVLHTHGASTDAELIGAARGALRLLHEGIASENAYAGALKELIDQARAGSDEALVRDFLLGATFACYFAEFAGQAAQLGLSYIGDAQPQQEIATAFGNHVALNHSLISMGKPKVLRQQYLDFAVGRKYRQTLLVHGEREGEALGTPDLARLKKMRLAGAFQRQRSSAAASRDGAPRLYQAFSGACALVASRNDIMSALIEALDSAWPTTVSWEDLQRLVPRDPLVEDESRHGEDVARELEALFLQGVLRYSVDAGPYDRNLSGPLKLVGEFDNAVAALGEGTTHLQGVNLWQQAVSFPLAPSDRFVLPLVREGRAYPKLVSLTLQAMRDGVLSPPADRVKNDAAYERQAADIVVDLVDRLRRAGMLHGGWSAYFVAAMPKSNSPTGFRGPYLDALLVHAWVGRDKAARAGKDAKGKEARGKEMARLNDHYKVGRWKDVVELGDSLVKQFPDDDNLWLLYGNANRHLGQVRQAASAIMRSLALAPLVGPAHSAMGLVFQSMMLTKEAERAFYRCLFANPDSYAARVNLSMCLKSRGRLNEAEAYARQALQIDPEGNEAYDNLAMVVSAKGDQYEAIELYRKAMSHGKGRLSLHSNMLFALCHVDSIDPDELFREHLAYGEVVRKSIGGGKQLPLANSRDPERKLRVGFVSGDLYRHAVANFVEPIWKAFDREQVELYAYYTNTRTDELTHRLRRECVQWRQVLGLSHADAAQVIQADGIDILIDLSGHTAFNLLPTFERRVAPVQISWIGYPGTTGLGNMDYYLLDKHAAPPGHLDAQFTEKLVYLDAAATFKPYDDTGPQVNALPALSNGALTFGSFNRPSKIGNVTLELWARVLQALPKSRMLLGGLEGEGTQDDLAERFAKHGITRDRLTFRMRAGLHEYLGMHHDVDIMLDTFPYTGGTTTNYSLWMGIPVLTLRGLTRVSCQTASGLGPVGLSDWVAATPQAYVDLAASWAGRLNELAAIRGSLRDRLLQSGGNPDNVARGLERAFRQMWRRWCEGLPAESFSA